MAFVHGKSSRVILDAVAFSGFLRGFEAGSEREMADSTVLTDSGHRYVPGLDTGTVSFDGLFDNTVTAGSQDATLDAAHGAAAASVISLAPDGFALGNRVKSCEARENNYTYASPVADVVSFQASWQSEGIVDSGVSLHDLTSVSATGNGTSVDNTASSANGAVGALHVTANTRDGSTTIKIQDSADNSVWADLITFTVVGATTTTAERVAVTGTVDRYTRIVHTLAGTTGAITYAAAVCRR
jgi:hypothetical protein